MKRRTFLRMITAGVATAGIMPDALLPIETEATETSGVAQLSTPESVGSFPGEVYVDSVKKIIGIWNKAGELLCQEFLPDISMDNLVLFNGKALHPDMPYSCMIDFHLHPEVFKGQRDFFTIDMIQAIQFTGNVEDAPSLSRQEIESHVVG